MKTMRKIRLRYGEIHCILYSVRSQPLNARKEFTMMKHNRNVQKSYTAACPLRQILPHIDGISAVQRQQAWSGSPWKAFRSFS